MGLRVYLAGNVALECDGVLVTARRLPGRQGRLAFAVLAAGRDHAISSERLAAVVWDEDPPAAWPTALRALVSKLRGACKELPADVRIEHALGTYQLRLPPDAWVDLEAAGSAIHAAESALRHGDLVTANGEALVANAIARRPFLEGDAGTWVEGQRGTLRAIRMRALAVRSEVALANGDPVGAASDAELLIGLEPYRESAYVTLMRAQVAAGDAAEALATYERLRALLADELGTDPSTATQAVFRQLLQG